MATKESLFTFNNRFYIQCSNMKAKIFLSHHKKTVLINALLNLNQCFIESMLMIFLYLLNPVNLSRRNVFVKLPFLGSTLFQIRNKLQQLFSDKLTSCNKKIKKGFTWLVRVKSCFTFKDKLPNKLLSVVAAMLPITERPNAILISKFVNI